MPKVYKLYDEKNRHYGYVFHCPGCGFSHAVYTEKYSENGSRWEFNGDMDNPTFRPSLLNRGPFPEGERVCHLFVTNGKIQYLSDCTHELAGKTLEMEETT
jgi:hypothetical protein